MNLHDPPAIGPRLQALCRHHDERPRVLQTHSRPCPSLEVADRRVTIDRAHPAGDQHRVGRLGPRHQLRVRPPRTVDPVEPQVVVLPAKPAVLDQLG